MKEIRKSEKGKYSRGTEYFLAKESRSFRIESRNFPEVWKIERARREKEEIERERKERQAGT